MKKKHICLISQSHLSNNPRLLKEALSLASAGYQITILNSTNSKPLARADEELLGDSNIRVHPIASMEQTNFLTFSDRIVYKIGRLLVRYLKIQTPLALGYGSWRYLAAASQLDADLYIGHQELGLYCGVQLLKSKRNVAFDLEDWYSEDLLEVARRNRPIALLKKLEKAALVKGNFCSTTSKAMAEQFAIAYRCPIPKIIYNTFPGNTSSLSLDKRFNAPLKLLWFSQTIGPGRGLESFLSLIGKIESHLEIHLLGSVEDEFKRSLARIQRRHPIYFHPQVPAQELPGKIGEFDIGLALEDCFPPSRNLTITNKLFQYFQSGLPVIATETAGQKEIFEEFKFGIMLSPAVTRDQVEALKKWLKNPNALQKSRKDTMKAACFYSWEKESKKFLELVKYALEPKS